MKRVFLSTLAALAMLSALGSIASAEAPRGREMDEVRRLASSMNVAATRLAERAQHQGGSYGWGQASVLHRLERLEAAAERFHRAVERHEVRPYRTERAFRELLHAYTEAAKTQHELNHRGVERDFRAVRVLLDELEYYYVENDRPDMRPYWRDRY